MSIREQPLKMVQRAHTVRYHGRLGRRVPSQTLTRESSLRQDQLRMLAQFLQEPRRLSRKERLFKRAMEMRQKKRASCGLGRTTTPR